MGAAKGKRAAHEAWYAGLTADEKTIVDLSRLLHDRLNKRADYARACYFYAMFLRKFLKEEKGILVTPVVGWAGYRGNVFGHAWAEYEGKKIDLSLTRTQHPAVAPPGPLIVLDRSIGDGVTYDYMPETSEEIAAVAGDFRVSFCEKMRMVARSDDLIDQYFDDAPAEHQYRAVLQHLQ